MNASDYAAWWGAIVSTIVGLWEIWTGLRSGPRVRVRATPNMEILGPFVELMGDLRGKTFISVVAVNVGTAPTTITHFGGYFYPSFWRWVLGRPQNFVVPTGLPIGKNLPHVLPPGEEWSNMIDQGDVEERMFKGKGGALYVGVIHNQKTKGGVYVRLKLAPKERAGDA